MKEERLIDYFDQDLEDILGGHSPKHNESLPQGYKEVLDVAVSLSRLDYSPDEAKRNRKRQQIINGYKNCSQKGHGSFEGLNRRAWAKPVLATAAAALVITLAVSVAYPGKLTAAARNVTKIIAINKYVTVESVDCNPMDANDVGIKVGGEGSREQFTGTIKVKKVANADIKGTTFSIALPVRNDTGADNVVYPTLAEAQKTLKYRMLSPQYMPPGYSFKEAEGIRDSNNKAVDDYINLYYQRQGNDVFILMQRVLGDDSELYNDGETVDINGETGVWMKPNSLAWKKAGVVYNLVGNGLSQEESIKIARSVK